MPQGGQSVATLTPDIWSAITRVNDKVNTDIAPQDDLYHYGRAEFWTIPTDGIGDCDDYAVTKRKSLIQAGLPELALRIAVVLTRQGDRHAILTIATDKGDFVLDNLRSDVVSWSDTGYTWIERQAATDPWSWVALQDDSGGWATASAGTTSIGTTAQR